MATTTESADATTSTFAAKQILKSLLVKHKSDGARHPEVESAITNLIAIAAKDRGDNIEWCPTKDVTMNQGRWRSVSESVSFPGKLPEEQSDGKLRYTLGRMSFGMFAPTKIVCSVDEMINLVEPINDEGDENDVGEKNIKLQQGTKDNTDTAAPAWKQTYTNEVLVHLETPTAKLPATLTNYGMCFTQSPTRLGVKFTSGTLTPRFDLSNPDNESLISLWKDIFDCAIAKEADEKSYLSQFRSWTMQGLMKVMMGLEPPVDTSDYTQTYTIKRPYVGYLDILYLDEDLRITRGNRGTVVVVERVKEDEDE